MTGWTPQGAGAGFELSTVLKPLAAYKDDMLVLTGLAQHNGLALGDGPGDHARAAASYLTGVHPKKTAGADIQNGVSADQIVAQHIGKTTRFASIELGCDDSRTVGNCDSGYSCAYSNSLAWRSENSPMPPETNPRLVFERLFGADAHLDPAARQRRMLHRRSILDVVGERTKQLSNSLGASDRRKVDEYLHAVREIERQIEVAESDMRDLRPGIDKPTRHSGRVRRLREADVRPAGRRVPDRSHARRHDDGRPRGVDAARIRKSACPIRTTRSRTTATTRTGWRASSRSTSSTPSCSPTSSAS